MAAIYSSNMTSVWRYVFLRYENFRPSTDISSYSGGIAFEYFADSLGYGLTANTTSIDGPISTNNQFTLLAAQFAAAKPAASTIASAVSPAYIA